MNNKTTRTLALISTIAILVNCGGADDADVADDPKPDAKAYSDFAEVTSRGEISISSLKEKDAGEPACIRGYGCGAYAIGHSEDGVNFKAISGFQPDGVFNRRPPASTKTTYDTWLEFTRIDVDGSKGHYTYHEKYLEMEFDPSTGIFNGGDEYMDFNTKVDGFDYKGTFSGNGVEKGVVEGKINQYNHIGAFHGNNEDTSVAGFMMGYEQTD